MATGTERKTRQDASATAKARVLMSGHLPPPMGGMAAFYQAMLASSLPERVDLCFVQTSSRSRALADSGSATASNIVSALQDCARFARAALRHRPQVAHIGTAYGLSFVKHSLCVLIARVLGSRVLLHPHCSFAVLYTDRSARWRWYVNQVVRLCDGIVALSHEWEQLRAFVPTCRIYALPNAIDRVPYADIARGHMARLAVPSPSNNGLSLRALYLGYLGKAKGSHDLVEAARELQAAGEPVSFDLVGDELAPGELGALRQRIESAGVGDHVRLHQAVYGADKLARFRDADLLVYPSYHEGMPMAVLEAMACALPIVATRVGGLPDLVIEGFNGLLVDPGQPKQLVEAIRRLAASEDLRHTLGVHSYQLVLERFDMEQRVQQLADIYGAVLAAGKVQPTEGIPAVHATEPKSPSGG
jgi:glycosyltransferase involved in cell wall biosynthesis